MPEKLSNATIDRELHQILQRDEKIHWAGSSENPPLFILQDILLVPFSIFWAGFSLYWEASVLSTHADIFLALAGIPFILMGLYLTFGRFVVRDMLLRSTFYAVTNRRVVVVTLWPKKRVQSLPLDVLRVSLTLKKNGVGDLIFGDSINAQLMRAKMPELNILGTTECLSFFRIRNANELFFLISKLQLQTTKPQLTPVES